MIQVCIWSGHEGQLGSENKLYLTLMGGCELVCPTMARQILARRKQERNGSPAKPRQVFVTIMGGTEIKVPTLAQEYVDFRDLLHSSSVTMEEWDRYVTEVGRADVSVASFTLMGGFSDGQLPSENEEIDSLAVQLHLGSISEDAGRILQYGIGQHGAERRATVRRAVAVNSQPIGYNS